MTGARPDAEAARGAHASARARRASRSTSSRATPRSSRSRIELRPRHLLLRRDVRAAAGAGRRRARAGRAPGRAHRRSPHGRRRGSSGSMFKTIGSYMPPPPPELKPPVMWGEEHHVRSLFQASGAELSFERQIGHVHARVADRLGRIQRARPRPGGDGEGGTRAAGPIRRPAPAADRALCGRQRSLRRQLPRRGRVPAERRCAAQLSRARELRLDQASVRRQVPLTRAPAN